MWKNLRNLVFGGVASKVLLGLANIFLIRELTKSDFTLLSNFLFIQSMVSGLLFTPFLLAAVPFSNLKKIQNYNRFFSALNWFQMGFLAFIMMFAWLYGPELSIDLFHKSQFYPSILLGLGASIVMTFQNILLSQQVTVEAYKRYNVINIIRPIALLTILGTLYAFNYLNFWTASLSFLFSISMSFIGDLSSFFSLFSVKGFRLRLYQFNWFWNSAWMLVVFFFVRGTFDHIGFFYVTRYFSIEDIANFSVPSRYYYMADLIIVTSHIPFINSFTKESSSQSRAKFVKWIKVTGLVSLFGLLILPFSKEIFVLLSGEKYEVSFPYFCILMIGLIPYLCFSPAIYGVIAKDGGRFLLSLSLLSLLIHLGFCWFGSQNKELNLIAFSTVFSRAVIYVGSTIYLFKR